MNLKSSLQTSAIFTGVASMYIGPLLAIAANDRPSVATIIEDRPRTTKVQFYFEERAEEVQEDSPELSNKSNNQLEEAKPQTFDHPQVKNPSEGANPIQESTNVRKSAKKKRNRYQDCQDNPGISQSGERYHVDRRIVDYYARLTHYNELGHARWHQGDAGERDGFRVRRIHCDLREAGMRNGDIVNSINGRMVTSVREAIRLWLKIRRKNRVVLDITRKGRPLTLTYQFRRINESR
ncbi:MAG TPA: hypothetical protein EYQ00_08475 [Dehalococcoidia bacterium]|nr:hypothetical protein [Dehalococcoidia bacterium]